MTAILMITLIKITVVDCIDNSHILYTCRCSEPAPEKHFPPSAAQTNSKKNIWEMFCFKSSHIKSFKGVLCLSRSHRFQWQLQTNLPDLAEMLKKAWKAPISRNIERQIKPHAPNAMCCSEWRFWRKITLFSGAWLMILKHLGFAKLLV